MFGELRVLLFVSFFLSGVCMGVWEWMCECKFVFTMPFVCADSGPWRRMSRAWSPMSAITTSSGSTCPSHQDSAWGAAEARQERVIVEVVRKGIVVGKCWSLCWTHLQVFSVSTVLGDKASDVEQSWRASAKLPGRRPPSLSTGKNNSTNLSHLVSWRFCSLFSECAWVDGSECVSECLPLRCHSCAQTLDRGEGCLGHDLNYGDNDIISCRHHVSDSPGVSLGSCCTQSRKGYCACCYKRYCCRAMLLNTSTNVSVSTVLGEEDSDV